MSARHVASVPWSLLWYSSPCYNLSFCVGASVPVALAFVRRSAARDRYTRLKGRPLFACLFVLSQCARWPLDTACVVNLCGCPSMPRTCRGAQPPYRVFLVTIAKSRPLRPPYLAVAGWFSGLCAIPLSRLHLDVHLLTGVHFPRTGTRFRACRRLVWQMPLLVRSRARRTITVCETVFRH